jgi:xylitol oxidase
MDKREFLKTSGAFLAGTMLSPLASGGQTAGRTNWSGNYTYSTDRLHQPQTIEQVQQVVKSCSKLRALGARHSFNGIADSTENQISLIHLDQMDLNREASTVTVGAGVTYSRLAPYLDGQGYALHNLASLPQISVAGAIATATHGSGIKNGNLSTAVTGLEVVTADGKVLVLSREHDGDRFQGAAVNLGAIGIVTKVTLAVQPAFQVSQVVYENLSMDQLEHHLQEVFASSRTGRITGSARYGSSGAWPRETRLSSPRSYLGQPWQPGSSIPFPDIRQKVVPNNWVFPVHGTNGCLISA